MEKSIEQRSFQQSVARAVTICFILAVSVLSVAGQIRIGGVTIGGVKKPDVKQPEANKPQSPGNTSGSTNQPTANRPNSTNSTSSSGRSDAKKNDPTIEDFKAFQVDAAPYKDGILGLQNLLDEMGKDYHPGQTEAFIRKCLDDGAALARIAKQKYPTIEDPSWVDINNFEQRVGTWRHLAEDREKIVKDYLNDKVGANVRNQVKELDKARARLSTGLGYELPSDFYDREKAHATIAKWFTPMFAMVGMTMPDNSVFAPYDTALDALIAEGKKNQDQWGWGAKFHDPVIEAKIRSLMPRLDPKATILHMGLTDAAWEVNKNSLGIPEGRYKRGLVMYRAPGVDTCVVAKFSFEQNYEGGGRYSAMAQTSGFTYLVRLQNCTLP